MITKKNTKETDIKYSFLGCCIAFYGQLAILIIVFLLEHFNIFKINYGLVVIQANIIYLLIPLFTVIFIKLIKQDLHFTNVIILGLLYRISIVGLLMNIRSKVFWSRSYENVFISNHYFIYQEVLSPIPLLLTIIVCILGSILGGIIINIYKTKKGDL